MSREAFPAPDRTYKTYLKAKKVIDGLKDGNYEWCVCCTKDGRFFPHITYNLKNNTELSHFYFIEKGCCVSLRAQ